MSISELSSVITTNIKRYIGPLNIKKTTLPKLIEKMEEKNKKMMEHKIDILNKISEIKDQQSQILSKSFDILEKNSKEFILSLNKNITYNENIHNNNKDVCLTMGELKYNVENIFIAIPNPIVIFDENYKILEFNEKFKKMIGKDEKIIKDSILQSILFEGQSVTEIPFGNNKNTVNINGKIFIYNPESLYYIKDYKYMVNTTILKNKENLPIAIMKTFTNITMVSTSVL